MITVTAAAASAQSRHNELAAEQHDTINFGDIPDAINDLLQEGVAAYRRDKKRADRHPQSAEGAGPGRAGWLAGYRRAG